MKSSFVPPVPLPPAAHGFVMSKPVAGSQYPVDITFVYTRDHLYVPIAVRKPKGDGPFPVITMGKGDGRGGVALVEEQLRRYTVMQDKMIELGYVVVYVNYRNEIPHAYNAGGPATNLEDDISGGENRILKSGAVLDSDDMLSILGYLRTLPYVDPQRIGVMGVSHGGEMVLKTAAETDFKVGVAIEGASHEFLYVDTGPTAPRIDGELQYQNVDAVRKAANKALAMERIRRINTPILHMGRDPDHLQGIFRLAYEWMAEAGKDVRWLSHNHPEHGYPFLRVDERGRFDPDPMRVQAFEEIMAYLDEHLK